MIFFNIQNNKGFTLVELIVVITILAILGTIGFVSLSGYQKSARDSTRLSDVGNITKVIELTKLQTGSFPIVSNSFNVTFSGSNIWKQGTFGQSSLADARRLSELPTDPLTGNEYPYSTTYKTAEYQVGTILEKALTTYNTLGSETTHAADTLYDFSTLRMRGNYNGRFMTHNIGSTLYVLAVPSILTSDIGGVTLEEIINNNSFLRNGKKGIPGSYSGSLSSLNLWEFIPNSTGAVMYEGTESGLGGGQAKYDTMIALQNFYTGSLLANNPDIQAFLSVNPEEDANELVQIFNSYIQAQVGGLNKEKISLTAKYNIPIFISEWNTENPGSTGNTIMLPLVGSDLGGDNNFTVYWGDGSSEDFVTSTASFPHFSHTYSEPGKYTVKIKGQIKGWYFNNGSSDGIDKDKIIKISQWGNFNPGNNGLLPPGDNLLGRSFYGASNLNITATDAPNLEGVTTLKEMFRNTGIGYVDMREWDISGITNIDGMFYGSTNFDGDLSTWAFNPSLSSFENLFRETSFNSNISGWDVSNITKMQAMFHSIPGFNQDLSGWQVASVSNCLWINSGGTNATWSGTLLPAFSCPFF